MKIFFMSVGVLGGFRNLEWYNGCLLDSNHGFQIVEYSELGIEEAVIWKSYPSSCHGIDSVVKPSNARIWGETFG